MRNEQLQKITIFGMTALVIGLTLFGEHNSVSVLLFTLFLVAIPDLYRWVTTSPLFLAILGRIFTKQVIEFVHWIDENAQGLKGDEIDFTDAPWLPPLLREHWMWRGGALEMKRYLERKAEEQKQEERKKKNKRGNRGSS